MRCCTLPLGLLPCELGTALLLLRCAYTHTVRALQETRLAHRGLKLGTLLKLRLDMLVAFFNVSRVLVGSCHIAACRAINLHHSPRVFFVTRLLHKDEKVCPLGQSTREWLTSAVIA